MTDSATTFEPLWASPPGRTIRRRLTALGMDEQDLAAELQCSALEADDLLSGRSALTEPVAVVLSDVIGASAQFWVNRERQYREDLVRVDTNRWLEKLPTAKMTEYGWLGRTEGWASLARECLNFFDVEDVAEWRGQYGHELQDALLRISPAFHSETGAVAAWFRQARRESEAIDVERWDPLALKGSIPLLKRMTRKKDPSVFFPALQDELARSGVAAVVVRALPGCPASGAIHMLSERKAMMVVSMRHLVDDQFWFTVFHEIAHLLLHAPTHNTILDDPSRASAELPTLEVEANQWAARTLVPTGAWDSFPAKGRIQSRDIIAVSTKAGVSPGIVVGQLQHAGRIEFNQFNSLKRRFKWNGLTLEMA